VTVLVLNRRQIIGLIPGWLSDLGEDLVLVTAASAVPDPAASAGLGAYRHVSVIEDYDSPHVEQLMLDLARRFGVHRILGVTEIDVLRAARIRGRLHLPGQDLTSALAYRDKFQMKSILARAGLPVAPMRLLESAAALRDFAGCGGFPVVVKPVAGAGSVGVCVLASRLSVDRFIADHPDIEPGALLAESWIDGPAYHVDGLMAGGQVVQCWPSRMRYPNLDTVTRSRPFASWMLPPANPAGRRLREFLAAVVAALPGPPEVTAFHAEVFHAPDDRLVLCEIACRPGGGGIVPTYEHAFGINLYAASLRGQAGLPPERLDAQPGVLGGFAWFPARAGRLRELPAECPLAGVYRYVPVRSPRNVYDAPHSISDCIAQALVEGTADEDLDNRIATLEAWWDQACVWEPAEPYGC
jgi:biotin carboxylase